jgi:hypothetical protein
VQPPQSFQGRRAVSGASHLHHHLSQLPSRPPSTHTPWSGRGSGRPGGARHCTNDLDALGRVCSALPGSTGDGMGASPRTPLRSRSREWRPLHPGAGRSPAGGIILYQRMTSHPCSHAHSAPPGAASRGGDRRQAAPLRRRAPAPCAGLEPVKRL